MISYNLYDIHDINIIFPWYNHAEAGKPNLQEGILTLKGRDSDSIIINIKGETDEQENHCQYADFCFHIFSNDYLHGSAKGKKGIGQRE